MRGWIAIACFMAVAPSVSGCAWERRATLDAVDPGLRAKGQLLTGAHDTTGLRLGSYRVSPPQLTRQDADPQGALASDEAPRPVVQHRLDLDITAETTDRRWAIGCISQRRASAAMDYASVLDENRDEITVDCDVARSGEPASAWHFVTEAELSHNFAGLLSQRGTDRKLKVEVVMWVERFGKMKRHLPDAVAQVRDGDTTIAAMVLGKPEQAWLSAELDDELAEVSMSMMLALRFLPLGLEG